jgi:PD-(D/E)XK endonuclease
MAAIHPSLTGARTEAAVASALVRSGRAVFLPGFSTGGRVDLIYLSSGNAVRVQCKTARLISGALMFRTCSNTANMPRTYDGEVDQFGVYSDHTGLVYLVPAVALPSRMCSLRLDLPHNGQSAGVRWAGDYRLGPP